MTDAEGRLESEMHDLVEYVLAQSRDHLSVPEDLLAEALETDEWQQHVWLEGLLQVALCPVADDAALRGLRQRLDDRDDMDQLSSTRLQRRLTSISRWRMYAVAAALLVLAAGAIALVRDADAICTTLMALCTTLMALTVRLRADGSHREARATLKALRKRHHRLHQRLRERRCRMLRRDSISTIASSHGFIVRRE